MRPFDTELTLEQIESTMYYAYFSNKEILGTYLKQKRNFTYPPKISKKLPGSIWAITSFFNPAGYANKYQNYLKFREASKKQGLKLLCVELVFGENAHFELGDDNADILIKVRGGDDNVIWQKEPLLNIALQHLPEDCDKVIWIDCDLIFHNDNWVNETADLLEEYAVVQPFSLAVRLGKEFASYQALTTVKYGQHENQFCHGFARSVSYLGKQSFVKFGYPISGQIGFVWAIRREVIQDLGFFDSFVNGGSDSFMSCAFYGQIWPKKFEFLTKKLLQKCMEWRDKIYPRIQDSVFYTSGLIDHLWHGNLSDRKYVDREKVFLQYQFDPYTDVKRDEQGLLAWTDKNLGLRNTVQDYLLGRKEE